MEVEIGLFAGIFDENGRVLLRRRRRENPSLACPYEGDWELPGGTMEEENIWKEDDERIIGEELAREVKEETGLLIKVSFMPTMYPAFYIDRERGNMNFAFIIPVGVVREKPTIAENIYLDPKKLKELSEGPEGNRIVSGWGNRMCRMALLALCHSPNRHYRQEAKRMLLEVGKQIK